MSVYRFDDFDLDCETRELPCSGQPVHVMPKAFHLLEVLVSSRPRAWSKSALQDALWPDTTVVEANLANLLAELRAALADNPAHPRYIRTIHRHGFVDSSTPPPQLFLREGRGRALTHSWDESRSSVL